jgi:hypothetical protein
MVEPFDCLKRVAGLYGTFIDFVPNSRNGAGTEHKLFTFPDFKPLPFWQPKDPNHAESFHCLSFVWFFVVSLPILENTSKNGTYGDFPKHRNP